MFDRTMRVCLAILLAVAFSVVVYSEVCSESVKVFVDIQDGQDPFEKIPQLRQGITQKIEKVEEVDSQRGQYEITFRVAKKKKSLLESILGKAWVERAEIREDDDD